MKVICGWAGADLRVGGDLQTCGTWIRWFRVVLPLGSKEFGCYICTFYSACRTKLVLSAYWEDWRGLLMQLIASLISTGRNAVCHTYKEYSVLQFPIWFPLSCLCPVNPTCIWIVLCRVSYRHTWTMICGCSTLSWNLSLWAHSKSWWVRWVLRVQRQWPCRQCY